MKSKDGRWDFNSFYDNESYREVGSLPGSWTSGLSLGPVIISDFLSFFFFFPCVSWNALARPSSGSHESFKRFINRVKIPDCFPIV